MIEVRVPTSKSVTQRALVLAALAPGRSELTDPLDCDDSRVLRRALAALGVSITEQPSGLAVDGATRFQRPAATLDVENAGTATRFCTGLTLLAEGPVTLDGNAAMRRRPMPGLLEALRRLGARVEESGAPSCPPVTIHPPADLGEVPATVELDAAGSSQQLSALLLVAPRLPLGLRVVLTGELPSAPYVELTLEALRTFGATVEQERTPDGRRAYHVLPGGLRGGTVTIEGDHSSASYPIAAGFLTGQPVEVVNVRPDSLQGDRVFPELLDQLRAPGPRELDLGQTPDIAPTVATCALFARGETRLTNLAHLRIKESDRLAVLAAGFRQVGADLDERPDGLVIRPRALQGDASLDPGSDHRMAMCFGLLGLRLPNLRILDPDCVSKSYPNYFSMLDRFRDG